MANELDLFRGLPSEFRDLFGMSRRLNRFFDDMFEGAPLSTAGRRGDMMSPRLGLEESEDQYLLHFEMPGVPKDDIRIEVTGNQLHVSGEKRTEGKGEKRGAMQREYLHYEQTLTLPEAVDSSKVEAEYKDGILYVAVPKSEQQKTRRVEIGSGERGLLARLKGRAEKAIGKSEAPSPRSSEKAA